MSFESIKTIPRVGFGLWKINGEICEATVFEALRAGNLPAGATLTCSPLAMVTPSR
jgi:hypothetical protein